MERNEYLANLALATAHRTPSWEQPSRSGHVYRPPAKPSGNAFVRLLRAVWRLL